METNGIIRRIDDLGRIVIPREYRKALGIDVGDPMEICATGGGEILIKKVNTSGELVKFGKKLFSAAHEETGGTVGLCDGEKWVLCYGERGRELLGTSLGKDAPTLSRTANRSWAARANALSRDLTATKKSRFSPRYRSVIATAARLS